MTVEMRNKIYTCAVEGNQNCYAEMAQQMTVEMRNKIYQWS